MQDEHLREALYEKLSVAMKRNGVETADRITDSEIEAVLRGDIPYFYSRTDSCDLYADGEVVFPDFFRVNSMDHLRSRIDYLSKEDMAFEETLLRKAMTRVVEHHPAGPELRQPVTKKRKSPTRPCSAMPGRSFVNSRRMRCIRLPVKSAGSGRTIS